MDAAATAVPTFSMSTDAFAAAIGKGAALRRPPLIEALRTGLIFGVVEAITPIIRWTIRAESEWDFHPQRLELQLDGW